MIENLIIAVWPAYLDQNGTEYINCCDYCSNGDIAHIDDSDYASEEYKG